MNSKKPPEPDFFSAQVSSARRFCLDLKQSTDERVAVACGGCEHCTPDYEIHRPGFPYWTIEFVAQGKGHLDLADRDYPLGAGVLFAYGPNISHDIVTDPEALLVKYFVTFSGRDAQALLERYGPTPGSVIQSSAPSDILRLFDDLIHTGLSNTALSPRIAAVILEQMILRIAETTVPLGAASSPAFATYRRCRQHIETQWASLSTLEQVAEECEVDPAYLCRLFRRFDRQSPYQYLLRQKMSHAAARLLQKGATVRQVADELGFGDPFHFSRVFRKVMGLAPGQFARLHQRS